MAGPVGVCVKWSERDGVSCSERETAGSLMVRAKFSTDQLDQNAPGWNVVADAIVRLMSSG